MKIVSAHQPAYFPWLGYLHKILVSDIFVIMDDVQFEKNSFINRNKILQGDNSFWLTIPVLTGEYKSKTIRDIEIANDLWKKKHLTSIFTTYKKTEYFDLFMPIVEQTLTQNSRYMIDYCNKFLMDLLDLLEIDVCIKFSSDLDLNEKKFNYVLELTKKVDGDLFVFGKFGREYVIEKDQQNCLTKLYFQDFIHPTYDQSNKDFIPYISALDALFRIGPSIKGLILSQNIQKIELKNLYGKS